MEISDEASASSKNEITASAEKIFARWRGRNLGERAKVRVTWIAEDVGNVAPSNYEIDDASTIASGDARGVFTLARPADGWTPGAYRVDFYLDDRLAAAVRLKIKPHEAETRIP